MRQRLLGPTRAGLAVQAGPLAVILALALFMGARDGGYDGTVWYPVALLTLALAVGLGLVARTRLVPRSRAGVAAVAALGGLTLWSFLTILWAADRGSAWSGSNRGLLYLLVFAVLASWRASSGAYWPLLLAAGVVSAADGVFTVERAIHASDPSAFLIGSRLSEPLGYPNAAATFFMIMAWLMIGLASRPWVPVPARGLAFALASLHLALNLLAESRGSVFTLPLVVGAFLILVPGRLRSCATLALVAIGFAPVVHPVLRVYGAEQAQLTANLRYALDVALVWAVIVGVAGWIFAAFDNRLHPPPRLIRAVSRGLVSVAALAAIALLLEYTPWQHVGSAWHSFRSQGEPTGAASHFGGLGSARYDFWRVGLLEFEHHPVQGIGTDNFLIPYLQLGRSKEQGLYPHSLAVRLLSQNGLVGAAFAAAFFAFALVGVARIPRGRDRELAGVLVVAAAVWFFHGLVDWLWEMPALGVLGVAFLGAALALGPDSTRPVVVRASVRRLSFAGAAIAAAAAVLTFVLPWLALRDVRDASRTWHRNPAAAFAQLDRAHSLNPLDDQADVVGGAIAGRLHRYAEMRVRYGRAVARSPQDWYANLELGIADALTGRRQTAAVFLRRAAALNPRDEIVRDVLRTFASGRRIDSDAVDRAFAAER